MLGLMQDWPLLVHKVLDHAATYAGDKEIVTRGIEGPMRRTNWRAVHERSRRLAKALARRGIKSGDRLATLRFALRAFSRLCPINGACVCAFRPSKADPTNASRGAGRDPPTNPNTPHRRFGDSQWGGPAVGFF